MNKCNPNSDRVDKKRYLRYLRLKDDENPKRYEFIIPDQKDFFFTPSFNTVKVTRYYQVCMFRNPKTNKYHARRFIVNANNEFTDIQELQLDEKKYARLLDLVSPNQYKTFATYSLDHIDYPSFSDIITAQSEILCENYNYTGNAPFYHS